MKKVNKKVIFILVMAMVGTFSLTMLQVAATDGDLERRCVCCTVVEYDYDGMDAEKAEQIVNLMLGKATPQRNILCIFGHDKRTGTVRITEHYYYATSPRCREVSSNVEYCARSGCDYYVVKGQSTNVVFCH